MSIVIRISDAAYQKLQRLAIPLVDTPASVVERVLDFYDQHKSTAGTTTVIKKTIELPSVGSIGFDPASPPDLTHARVKNATVGESKASTWKGLLQKVHIAALAKLQSLEVLQRTSTSNLVEGRKHDKGYEYVRALGASIQNTDANVAWRQSFLLAKQVGIALEVEFEWLEKPGAFKPGERGVLSWHPVKSRK